jgi:hypothetical protein
VSAAISGTHLLRDNVSMARPMWQGPPAMTRPPNPGAAPQVGAVTGLGTGAGAGIGANSDSAWGTVRLFVGLAPAGAGSLTLTWPVTPPVAPVFAADWAPNGFTVTGANPYTVIWAGTSLVSNSKAIHLAYQWSVAD